VFIRLQSKHEKKQRYFYELFCLTFLVKKNRSRILELLTFCDGYNKWLAEGGRSKAASLAARSKKKKLQSPESS
jgi:hypothetical protein